MVGRYQDRLTIFVLFQINILLYGPIRTGIGYVIGIWSYRLGTRSNIIYYT